MPSLGARLSTRACASKNPLSKPLRSAPLVQFHRATPAMTRVTCRERGLRPRVAGLKETAATPNPIPGVLISDKIYSQDPDLSLKETRFGIVYSGRRRRLYSQDPDLSLEERSFGIVYSRLRRRRPPSLEPVADDSLFGAGMQDGENVDAAARLDLTASVRHFVEKVAGISDDVLCTSMDDPMVLAVIVDACGSKVFPTILVPVLIWARRSRSRLRGLAAILFSGLLGAVLSLHGVHFLRIQHPRIGKLSRNALSGCGLCKIYSVTHFVPLISIDFFAFPAYFRILHLAVAFRSLYLPFALVRYSIDLFRYEEEAYSFTRYLIDPTVLAVLVEPSQCGRLGSELFPTILVSILRWARRPRSRLRSFAAILFSGSLGVVLSLHGIQFLPIQHPRIGALSRTALSGCGLCKIYSVRHFVPLISIDFSALPGYFTRLHVAGALCSLYLPGVLARYFIDVSQYQEEAYSSVPAETGFSGSGTITSAIHAAERSAPNVAEAPELIVQNWAFSPGLPLQKRLKNKRAKSQRRESFSFHTKSLNTYYHIVQIEEYNSSFSPGRLKSKKFVGNKRMKAALADMKQNIESAVCNANILVMASDGCWREEGAKLMLELSDSVEWCIEVKKQETRRYLYKPQYWRPPCHVNLFNHNYMWGWEDGWKLEFFDKWDWLVFKEMHMKCRQRNTLRVLKPIPAVAEVPGYPNTGASCFMRPDKYIHMVGDELERALSSEIASYDMDSEDEEWLKQLTSRSLDSEDKCLGYISEDDFEKIIFFLEKDVYNTNNKNKDPSKKIIK